MYDLIVVGGGASGFFTALSAAEHSSRPLKIAILEQSKRVLQKVRISGGGRCNVTHAAFEPKDLTSNYPRGKKELLGPFHKFAPGDTMAWFEDRGVPLKIEEDGRVFPVSDSSQSIIDALLNSAKKHRIEVLTSHKVTALHASDTGVNTVQIQSGLGLSAKRVLIATGSGPRGYAMLEKLQVPLIDRVPSLFSFNVPDKMLHGLQGLSVPQARVTLDMGKFAEGPLLITHWGFSGPAVLRLSAEAAIELHACGYKTTFTICWIDENKETVKGYLENTKRQAGKKTLKYSGNAALPQRLWIFLLGRSGLSPELKWASLSKLQLEALGRSLISDAYQLNGQTRFKEEFVTAGGVDLSAIDFRKFNLRKRPTIYITGEVLNVDGITGGFNFQAAWTGGDQAGRAIAESLNE